ncbi:hypothetical protein [Terriglobus albidus]|uniref:hypothetical protein n=1 Tax=Terriglobus albidus TaxID=1592106 RepID=UPI0021DFA2C8|nr:hypothetical protein [Terriglobus albidus]
MKRYLALRVAAAVWMACYMSAAFAAQDVAGALLGTVKAIDRASKVVVVRTGDGIDHTFHYTDKVLVHGTKATATAGDDVLHGIGAGSKVVAHYSLRGTVDTVREIDDVGKDGLKVTEGTAIKIDHATRKASIKMADGTTETFRLTDHALSDTARDIGKGGDRAGKVTVYYTEEAGKKTAHFIAKAF